MDQPEAVSISYSEEEDEPIRMSKLSVFTLAFLCHAYVSLLAIAPFAKYTYVFVIWSLCVTSVFIVIIISHYIVCPLSLPEERESVPLSKDHPEYNAINV